MTITRDEFNAVWHTLTDRIAILDNIAKNADEKRHREKARIEKGHLERVLVRIEEIHRTPAPVVEDNDHSIAGPGTIRGDL